MHIACSDKIEDIRLFLSGGSHMDDLLIIIPSPLIAVVAVVTLVGTAAFWLFWPRYVRRKQNAPLAYEIVDGSPANQRDLHIYDESLALLGQEYDYIGTMPANFICSYCGGTECVTLRMYHHIPSHTMILLSRHKCLRLVSAETAKLPATRQAERNAGCSKSRRVTAK